MLTLLDGPLGTELIARGVKTSPTSWSASAIDDAAEVVSQIHRDYSIAGATVHTANTFRTKRRAVGDVWREWTRRAVELARGATAETDRVAGSIAPLEDCYRPDLSPADPRDEHREMAETLADAGCDILLCETFPHVGEATIAVEEAVRTGLPTWVALTAGPNADLLSPQAMVAGAKQAVDAGAAAVLVNCTPAVDTLRFVQALADADLGVPLGAYANAGEVDDQIGWNSEDDVSADKYLQLARQWAAAGATLIGGCCGTGPAHIHRLRTLRESLS